MFISLKKEQAMGIDVEASQSYRAHNLIPDNDDVATVWESLQCEDALRRARGPSSVSISAASRLRRVARRVQ